MTKYRVSLVIEADSLAAAVTRFMLDEDAQYQDDILEVDASPWG